ncbi:MAG: ATP-binding protein [Spirochaetota bacterium]
MKIRTRLILLAAGAILIPILVMGIAGYLSYRYTEEKRLITPHMTDQIAAGFERALAGGLREVPPLPEGMDALVFDPEGVLVYSSTTDDPSGGRQGVVAAAGSALRPLLLAPPSRAEERQQGRRFIMSIPLWVNGEPRGTLVLGFPPRPPREGKGHPRRTPLYLRIMERGVYGFGAFVVFASVMVFFIIRSINRSTGGLERATRKVAEGDLDFELHARGNDELAALTRSFESMRRELRETRDQRARFLMGVSHDLKTPLTSIEGYVEAVRDGLADTPEKLHRYLGIIQDKTELLRERILHLIDYVKMETGEWKLRNEEILLGDFLGDLARTFQDEFTLVGRDFSADIRLPPGLKVKGDRDLLARAFENLATNAIRHTGEHDAVSLTARAGDGRVTVTFSDTGPGIPSEHIEHLFEPFYRASASRREQGTGLGLSVVKSIFASHGWEIEVSSAPGEGTIFRIQVTGTYR